LKILAGFFRFFTLAVAVVAGTFGGILVCVVFLVPMSSIPDHNEGHALAAALAPRFLSVAAASGLLSYVLRRVASRFPSEEDAPH
jgi:hypothetical protein